MNLLAVYYFANLLSAARVDVVRKAWDAHSKMGPFVTVNNAIMSGQLAFTTTDLQRVYVDFEKFKSAPVALSHVIDHELAHTEGAVHGDGSRAMAYHVSVDQQGNVIEDNFL